MLILRRGKIPAILFMGGPMLMGLFFIVYYLFFTFQAVIDPFSSRSGRELFGRLSLSLFWGLMLFVPALVGASISKDRRAGTLSTLRLTHLSAWRILLGKLSAFAAFYSLVFLATTPIVGLTFLVGGVSVSEFLGLFFLTLATAIQCSILSLIAGLLFKRSATAMVGGFVLALVYLLMLPNLAELLGWIVYYLRQVVPWPWLEAFRGWVRGKAQWINTYVFPTRAIGKVFAPGAMPTVAAGPFELPFWMLTVAGVGITSALSLALAAYLMRIELWLRPRRALIFRFSRGMGKLYCAENLLDERKNPFLKWEMERHPVWRHRRKVTAAGAGVGLLFFALFVFLLPTSHFEALFLSFGWYFEKMIRVLIMLIPIFYCSQTVVREREMGTYDALVLTLLQPKQIIESKLKSCLLYISPLLGITAVVCLLSHFTFPNYSPFPGGVGMVQMNFVWLAFQVVRCLYFAMLGIFFSLYCRTTLHALAFTVGAEILLMIPYGVLQLVFGCCGNAVFMLNPWSTQFTGDNILLSVAMQYASTLLRFAVPAIFMLVVIRVLYDRSINLIRFESYRR